MNLTKKGLSYFPSYPADLEESNKIRQGAEVHVTKSRNPKFFRKGMALLQLGFDNQNKYDDFNMFRQSVLLEIGFCKIGADLQGEMRAFPESMAWDAMSEERFEEFYKAALPVISNLIGVEENEVTAQLMGFY